jgi:hypothetical protein
MGPRDSVARFTIPVNVETGEPLTDGQIARIDQLRAAHESLLNLMHDCEGSDHGNPTFQSRRMAIAATQLEMGMMMAVKAALEAK